MPNQSNMGPTNQIPVTITTTGTGITGVGGTYIYPTTTGTGGTGIGGTPIYPTTATGTSIYPYQIISPQLPAFLIFKLPDSKMPDMVFLNGRALSLGLLGSEAQVSFGLGILFFDSALLKKIPEMVGSKPPVYTFILQYKTKTYHYYANYDYNTYVALKPNSNIIDAHVLSQIKRS